MKKFLENDMDLSKYTILIADDEEPFYVLFKRRLSKIKINIDWAKNGKIAVEMAEKKKYDLIFMDIGMPYMDGIEATKTIKSNQEKTPIVMQTAYASVEMKQQAKKAGCDDFLTKPISLNDILIVIEKFVLQ